MKVKHRHALFKRSCFGVLPKQEAKGRDAVCLLASLGSGTLQQKGSGRLHISPLFVATKAPADILVEGGPGRQTVNGQGEWSVSEGSWARILAQAMGCLTHQCTFPSAAQGDPVLRFWKEAILFKCSHHTHRCILDAGVAALLEKPAQCCPPVGRTQLGSPLPGAPLTHEASHRPRRRSSVTAWGGRAPARQSSRAQSRC